MSHRKVVKKSSTLHPSDELFLNGVPTDLLGTIPSINSIEALWEMSKLPRAQTEKIKVAIIKQVKRLERRKQRIERHGDDSSMLSTDSTIEAVNNTNGTTTGTVLPKRVYTESWDFTDPDDHYDDHHSDLSSIDESDFNRLAPLPSKNLFKNAHKAHPGQKYGVQYGVHRSSNYHEHSMKEFRNNQEDLSNGMVIARKESSLEEISQNLYSLFLSNTMINSSSRRSINSRNRGVVSLLQHAHTVKTAAQNKARRRARAWQIRQKKREKAGRTMFRALRRAFNTYLSHSFQRFKHGSDLVAAVETINELAEKEREMQRRHFAFQSKNTSAMLYWHACVKMCRTRMHHAWDKWYHHVIAFDTIRILIIRLTKIKLSSALARWALNATIMKAGDKVGSLNSQKKDAGVNIISKILLRDVRRKIQNVFSHLVKKTLEFTLLRKLFLRCTKIKLQGAFAMMQANARHATHEQLNETTNHAKELKNQLSSHLDNLKMHAASQLFMLFYRQSHHKIRRAFYILMTQTTQSLDLKYLIQSIVSRTARRKTNEAFNTWKQQMFSLAQKESLESTRSRAAIQLIRSYARIKKKLNTVDAFCHWKIYVRSSVDEEHNTKCRTFALKALTFVCNRLHRSRLNYALARWRQTTNYLISRAKDTRESSQILFDSVKTSSLKKAFHKLVDWVHVTSTISDAIQRKKLNILALAMNKWRKYLQSYLQENHSQSLQLAAVKAMGFGFKRVTLHLIKHRFTQWKNHSAFKQRQVESMANVSQVLSRNDSFWSLKRGFEGLKSWRKTTQKLLLTSRLSSKKTLRLSLATWRTFATNHRHWDTKRAATRSLLRNYKAICDSSVRKSFRKLKYIHDRWRTLTHALTLCSKVTTSNVTKKGLTKGFRRWVMHVFNQREETIHKSYTYDRVRTTLTLARKVLESVYVERIKEAFVTWHRKVMQPKKYFISRLTRRLAHKNVSMAFTSWINFTKSALKQDFQLLLISKVCTSWGVRVNAMSALALRSALRSWAFTVEDAKCAEISLENSKNSKTSALTRVMHSLYYCHLRESLKIWRQFAFMAKSQEANNVSLKLLVRSRIKTVTMEELRWGWTGWIRAVQFDRNEALKNKMEVEEQEKRAKLLKTLMRHRMLAIYSTYMRAALTTWAKYSASKKLGEKDVKSKNLRLQRFIGSKMRAMQMEGLRHGFACLLRNKFEEGRIALMKSKKDMERADSSHAVTIIVRHRIQTLISEHLRWAWQNWEHFVDDSRKEEIVNMSIDNENQAKNNTAKIILRHRIKQMYLDYVKDAFVEWLSLTLELRKEAEQTARDMEKLKIIMRQRFRDLMGGYMRFAWEKLLRNSFEESRIALMKSKKDMRIADSSHAVKIIMRHRLQTLISDHLRHAWKTWERFVDSSRIATSETKSNNKFLLVVMRHRINQLYIANLADAFNIWLEDTILLRDEEKKKEQETLEYYEQDQKRELQIDKFIIKTYRRVELEVLRHSWKRFELYAANRKTFEMEQLSITLDKARYDEKLRGIVKRRISNMISQHVRWALKSWEHFVEESRQAEIVNTSIDHENQVKNNTAKIIIRHRIKQMYLDNIKDAFVEWLALTLELRAEAEQTARDMEKLKIIMRQRF
ncbi:hypothetical protein TL16_g00202 [Triparma laevis f. inornata]|uniref:Sfi1 spindle body domain-containing protein n=1 Tax=Triparma laevis f. inornata TaxID=1714386 RepID=A0A9W6ZCS4_9STRA|nr:hypothetical protein TL16_g00202 [Triparma laevis f. inornata]